MNNICRTCLGNKNLKLIKNDETLIDKIQIIASIHISLDIPNYPTSICEDCIQKVDEFFCFRKIIINSDIELKEKISSMVENKTVTDNEPRSKQKNICEKSSKPRITRKTKRIQSQAELIPATNFIKPEIPIDDDCSLDRLVICETENTNVQESVKLGTDQEPSIQVFACDECDIKCSSKSDLILHRKTIHNHTYRKKTKSLECTECNITCKTLVELTNHRRNVHTAPGICNICGVVVRADNLKKHVQRHSEDPVTCKICNRVLKNSESLRGHLLIHKGTSFECKECDKTFRLKSEYHRHLKKHSDPNIRKKMCTICGKHVRDMQRHLFSHTGERPYICSFCNKGLTSSYALKLHIRQHTNEKPYICEYCCKGFAQKVSLLVHLKSKAHS